jgi:hypothetical protein
VIDVIRLSGACKTSDNISQLDSTTYEQESGFGTLGRSDRSHKSFSCSILRLAERVGFEPTVEFPLHTLSKRAPSTTRTSLRIFRISGLRASGGTRNPNCVANCVRPPSVPRSLTAILHPRYSPRTAKSFQAQRAAVWTDANELATRSDLQFGDLLCIRACVPALNGSRRCRHNAARGGAAMNARDGSDCRQVERKRPGSGDRRVAERTWLRA